MSTEQTTTPDVTPEGREEGRAELNRLRREMLVALGLGCRIGPRRAIEHARLMRADLERLRAELARVRPVVDAARAYAADETSSETLYSRLVDAVAALDVDAAATPQPANDITPTAGPSVDVTAEIAWHVTQLRRDGAAPVDGSAHYDEGWRNAYEQAANDMEARAEQRALATPTTEES